MPSKLDSVELNLRSQPWGIQASLETQLLGIKSQRYFKVELRMLCNFAESRVQNKLQV